MLFEADDMANKRFDAIEARARKFSAKVRGPPPHHTYTTPQIDPQMEELTKKLLQTDDDLEQLMAEILEDTMEVEMAASKEELEKAKEEIEHLKGELRRWK